MAIYENDLILVHAEDDSDFETGGGQLTAAPIVDGAVNNLFDAMAELDGALGAVKLRKFGAVVNTATTDRLQKAHLLITEPPANPLVEASLFSTGDFFDRRPDYAGFFESYLSAAGKFNGFVSGANIAGQRAVYLWLRPGRPLPEVGGTYCLVHDEGKVTESRQYVTATDVSSRTDTYTDDRGDYQIQSVTMEIGAPLERTFTGPEPSRYDPAASTYHALLRTTQVAAAANYYGVKPTTAAAVIGDELVQVESVFAQLVPNARHWAGHIDLNANGEDSTLVASGAPVSFAITAAFGAGQTLYLGTPFLRGSLSIAAGAAILTDDGRGQLLSGATVIGTVDYPAGTVTGGANAPTYSGSKTVTFAPAGAVQAPTQTLAIAITAVTQAEVYTMTLPMQPAPGTTTIIYWAQGARYVLRDRGDGVCVGDDDSYGVAQINFVTRSLLVTLRALPDPDTFLFVSWGIALYTFNRGGTALAKGWFEFETLAVLPPGGVDLAWNDGTARTATDDGAGNLTGDATGEVLYARKLIRIRPNTLPAPGTEFEVTITPRATASEEFPSIPRDGSGFVALTLAHGNVVPGSVSVESANWTFSAAPAWYPLPVPPPPRPIHQYAGISGL